MGVRLPKFSVHPWNYVEKKSLIWTSVIHFLLQQTLFLFSVMRKGSSKLLQCKMLAISCCKLDACSYLHIVLIFVGLTDCVSVHLIDKLHGAESFLKSLNRSSFCQELLHFMEHKFFSMPKSLLLASILNQMTLESLSVQPVSWMHI